MYIKNSLNIPRGLTTILKYFHAVARLSRTLDARCSVVHFWQIFPFCRLPAWRRIPDVPGQGSCAWLGGRIKSVFGLWTALTTNCWSTYTCTCEIHTEKSCAAGEMSTGYPYPALRPLFVLSVLPFSWRAVSSQSSAKIVRTNSQRRSKDIISTLAHAFFSLLKPSHPSIPHGQKSGCDMMMSVKFFKRL